MKKLSLLFLPFFVQALNSPPPVSPTEIGFHNQHPVHLSTDELKTLPAKPLFFPPHQKPQEQTCKIKTLSQHSLPLLKEDVSPTTSTELSDNQCYKDFVEKTGEELIEHIRSSNDENCLYHLFSKAPKNVRFKAFSRQNMIDTAEKSQSLIPEYEGQGHEFLRKLVVFVRAGYYNYSYHKEEMDWIGFKSAIDTAAVSLIEIFINNPHFYNVGYAHGKLLSEILILTDNMEKQAYFLPDYIAYLNQIDERYKENDNHSMLRAIHAVFFALFRGHYRPEFHSAITNNRELISALKNFALLEWVLESDDFIIQSANAALELSRFLQYDGSNTHYPRILVYEQVIEAIRDIVNRYRNNEEGKRIFISALQNILHYEKCQEYNVCGLDQEIKRETLNKTYQCSASHGSTALIHSQNLTEEKLLDICNTIKEQDHYFHEKFAENNIPVPDDYNTTIEVIVFDKPASYQIYSTLFFGNSTDNGGIYLEGDPSDPSNTARFITYLADWLVHQPVWNLKHEYVHYLDGRFNLYGDFSDYKVDTHKIVWWLEGLAEYMSKRDKHGWAATLLQSETPPQLSAIFQSNYSSSAELIYPWSYLANRFIFEKYPHEVNAFLNEFRLGQYDSYKNYIEEHIGDKYDTEFSEWLNTLEGLEYPEDEGRRSAAGNILFENTLYEERGSVEYDLTYYITIPSIPNIQVSAMSSDPEIATAIIFEKNTLIITPHSPGSAQITITIPAEDNGSEDNKPIMYIINISVVDFGFTADETLVTENGRVFKYIKPPALSLCEKTRTIDLLDYTAGSLPETAVFEIGVNHKENIADAEIRGHLLTITALAAGKTSIWIDMMNKRQRVDEILLEMEITGDTDQCEEEEEEDNDDESEPKCKALRIGNIWIPICH